MNRPVDKQLPLLRGPVPFSHLLLRQYLHNGDRAIDATCGNGGDTLLLAELVGADGHVWGFDIQQQAIDTTAEKLDRAGFAGRATLLLSGHERMQEQCPDGIAAVVFNLGYLPSGDKTIITELSHTLAACRQAEQMLRPGGVLIITCYPGHPGGDEEYEAVHRYAAARNPGQWHVWQLRQPNVPATAPSLLLIQKVNC